MRAKLSRWGNSLAVRVPSAILEDLALVEGSELTIIVRCGEMVIRPAKPQYKLDDLLEGYPQQDRHAEVDWGTPIGREVW